MKRLLPLLLLAAPSTAWADIGPAIVEAQNHVHAAVELSVIAVTVPEPVALDEPPPSADVVTTAPEPMPDLPAEVLSAEEEEMFGESAPAEEMSAEEAEIFGESAETGEAGLDGPLTSDTSIANRLAAEDETFTIGAYGNFRFQYSVLEEGNPEEFTFSSPSLFDLFADGRPNDRLRAYVRGRLTTDFSLPKPVENAEATDEASPFGSVERERVSVALDQLWLKFDIARLVFVTLGKQRIKWGTGRFWNPTDFLNQDRLDPLSVAVFDERLGVSMAKFHVPLETLGWNFYAIASLDEALNPESIGGAFRAEFLYDLTEVSLSTSVRNNNPLRIGADISTGLWLFDLRLEAAVFHNDKRAFYEGEFELPATFPTETSREEDWIPQVVAGTEITVQYSDEDSVTFGAEYFFNDMGYDDANLYPWLAANGSFTPFYLGRHYAGLYGFLAGPGSWNDSSFVLSALGNISDQSYIARFDFSQTILTELRFNAFVNWHFGDGEFRYGYEVPPNPLVPDGFVIVPPLFETGVGFQLNL